MKIAHIIREPRLAGVEMLVPRVCNEHLEGGVIPCIIATHPINKTAEKLVKDIRDRGIPFAAPSKRLGRVERLFFLRQMVCALAPDVIFAHTVLPSLFIRIAALGMGIPIITLLHAASEDYFGAIALTERIIPRPSAIISASEKNLAWYRTRFGTKVPMRLITNGVPLSEFAFDPIQRSKSRVAIFGDIGDEIVLAHLARLAPVKRQDITIKGFEALPKDMQEKRLLIFAGLTEDPHSEAQVRKAVETNPSIKFLGPRSDIAALYMAVDAIVLPSDHESNPIVAIEALSSGVSLILSDIPAHQFAKTYPGVTFANDASQMTTAMSQIKPGRHTREMSALDIRNTVRSYEALAREVVMRKNPESASN